MLRQRTKPKLDDGPMNAVLEKIRFDGQALLWERPTCRESQAAHAGEALGKRPVLKHEPERLAFRLSNGLREKPCPRADAETIVPCSTSAERRRHSPHTTGLPQVGPDKQPPTHLLLATTLLLSRTVGRGAPSQQAKHKKMAVTHASQFRRFHSERPRKSAASRASPRTSERPAEPRSR